MSPKIMYPRLLRRREGASSAEEGSKRSAVDAEECEVTLDATSTTGLQSGVSQADTTQRLQDDEDLEYSQPSDDLKGLLAHLDSMAKQGSRMVEVTYIVNAWTLGGIIPLQHHGFVIEFEGFGWLTLDFTRRGILWDTFEEYPDNPEGTVLAKRHRINADVNILRKYCAETKPFFWPGNDCSQWSQGLLRTLRIRDDASSDDDDDEEDEDED